MLRLTSAEVRKLGIAVNKRPDMPRSDGRYGGRKVKLIIPGRPATKKNSSRLGFAGKRRVILPSEAYERYETEALWHLKKYRERYSSPVRLKCEYWLSSRRWWPDLVGLLQATSDILQAAGILENDRLIESYDGSRIAGIDKENPRAEIEIEEYST